MGNGTFNQNNIGRRPPHEPAPTYPRKNLTLSSELDGDRLSFFFLENIVEGDGIRTERLDFAVDQDYEVVIGLDDSLNWHWSNRLSAVVTKRNYKPLYKDLMYSVDGQSFFYYDMYDDDNRFKFIKFYSKYNSAGDLVNGERHPFGMNINLVNNADKILAITIDPDIKNPPDPVHFEKGAAPLSGVGF